MDIGRDISQVLQKEREKNEQIRRQLSLISEDLTKATKSAPLSKAPKEIKKPVTKPKKVDTKTISSKQPPDSQKYLELIKQINRYKEYTDGLEKNLKVAQSNEYKLRKQLDLASKITTTIDQVREEINTIQISNDKLNKSVITLRDQLSKKDSEVIRLTDQLQKLNQTHDLQLKELQSDQISRFDEAKAEHQLQLNELHNKLEIAETQVTELTKKFNELTRMKSSLEIDISSLESELQKSKERLEDELQKLSTDYKKEIEDLVIAHETELESKEKAKAVLREKISELEKELEKQRTEQPNYEKLKKSYSKLQQRYNEQSTELSAATQELSRAQKQQPENDVPKATIDDVSGPLYDELVSIVKTFLSQGVLIPTELPSDLESQVYSEALATLLHQYRQSEINISDYEKALSSFQDFKQFHKVLEHISNNILRSPDIESGIRISTLLRGFEHATKVERLDNRTEIESELESNEIPTSLPTVKRLTQLYIDYLNKHESWSKLTA